MMYLDPRSSLVNFAAGLIRECLSAEPPVATHSQFSFSLEILNQISQQGKGNEMYVCLIDSSNTPCAEACQ